MFVSFIYFTFIFSPHARQPLLDHQVFVYVNDCRPALCGGPPALTAAHPPSHRPPTSPAPGGRTSPPLPAPGPRVPPGERGLGPRGPRLSLPEGPAARSTRRAAGQTQGGCPEAVQSPQSQFCPRLPFPSARHSRVPRAGVLGVEPSASPPPPRTPVGEKGGSARRTPDGLRGLCTCFLGASEWGGGLSPRLPEPSQVGTGLAPSAPSSSVVPRVLPEPGPQETPSLGVQGPRVLAWAQPCSRLCWRVEWREAGVTGERQSGQAAGGLGSWEGQEGGGARQEGVG